MESPFLGTAAYNVVYDQSPQHWFLHYVQENTTLFGRTRKADGRLFRCVFLRSMASISNKYGVIFSAEQALSSDFTDLVIDVESSILNKDLSMIFVDEHHTAV